MAEAILDFTEANGLVLCNQLEKAQNGYEKLYLAEVNKLGAYAVFFRRHFHEDSEKESPYKSEPAVCIFKEDAVPFNSSKHKDVHAALWSEGKVDIYILLGKTCLDIFNARKPAEKLNQDELTLDSRSLKLANIALDDIENERFSARLFGTGTFWEQKENQHHISVDQSPYKHLLDYLMGVRKTFAQGSQSNSLRPSTVDKLLVVSILIKFLEEKKDKTTQHSTLDDIYKKHQVSSMEDAVQGGHFLKVLDDLANEFNGKVFDLFPDERLEIEYADLSLLVSFLRADIDIEGQLFFWKQYSFQHLPAELISAIYENFIQAEAERDGTGREKGVVYTPIHLVNFLVDEAMPLDKIPDSFQKTGAYKILDPSCGSGVFLVAAYKRLLQWWMILEYQKSGKIRYPEKDIAQRLLEDNIYGVDVKQTAVLVTIFGLTTALLDHLTPKEVWDKLKFRNLRERNIIEGSQPTGFFQWTLDAKVRNERFSMVMGNPPFNPEKGVSKESVLNPNMIANLGLRHTIPRKNLALHFFEASMLLADKVCMIIPSNVLLYDKSAKTYRKDIFTNYTISDIFDFTHLRRELFSSVDTPVVAVLATQKTSDQSPINHTVVKRTVSFERKMRFEIDHYDRHIVKWGWAVDPEKQFVWKSNLLGGGRLFHLIYRLSLVRSFETFINQKGWAYSVGYKLEGGKKKPNVHYLHNKQVIVTSTFDESETFQTFIETNTDFSEPRNEEIYKPPHLIFKANLGNSHIPVHYSEKYLGFKDKLVGIHAPEEESGDLKKIYHTFKNESYSHLTRFWALATSSETLINLETTCKKEDIDSLPYPEKIDDLNLSKSETIILDDVLKFYIHLGKSISRNSDGWTLHQIVSKKQLSEYGEVLCSELNDIYAKNGNSWQAGKVCQTSDYTIFQIGFGPEGKLKSSFVVGKIDDDMKALLEDGKTNRGTVFKRIVRFYEHVDGFDCVYFVKPNAVRYWLRSIALRDADETFVDFKEGGY